MNIKLALKSCSPNSYFVHQPKVPYFLRSIIDECKYANEYTNGSQ